MGGTSPPNRGWARVVAAFDIDSRKVGRPLEEAIFSPPNNTTVFWDRIGATGVSVQMGPVLDGVALSGTRLQCGLDRIDLVRHGVFDALAPPARLASAPPQLPPPRI